MKAKILTTNGEGRIVTETPVRVPPDGQIVVHKGDLPSHRRNCFVDENGDLKVRPTLDAKLDKDTIVADGEDVATLSPLPTGIKLMVGEAVVIVNDGELQISSDGPDDITVEATDRESFPWLPEKWIVKAEAPE